MRAKIQNSLWHFCLVIPFESKAQITAAARQRFDSRDIIPFAIIAAAQIKKTRARNKSYN